MSFQLEIAWILAVFLLAIRLGVLFFVTPLDGFGRLPARIRVFSCIGLSMLLVSVLDINLAQIPATVPGLARLAINELIVGLALVLGIYAAFAAFMMAGNLLDFQIGFSAAALFDPGTQTQNPLLGLMLSLLALVLFFALDGHHLLLRGIAYSVQTIPPGQGLAELRADLAIRQFGLLFIYGLLLAAPVLAGLMLLDVGLGVMARSMPQMNVYFVMLPLKILFGLFLLALSLRYMLPVIEQIFQSMFVYWDETLEPAH